MQYANLASGLSPFSPKCLEKAEPVTEAKESRGTICAKRQSNNTSWLNPPVDAASAHQQPKLKVTASPDWLHPPIATSKPVKAKKCRSKKVASSSNADWTQPCVTTEEPCVTTEETWQQPPMTS